MTFVYHKCKLQAFYFFILSASLTIKEAIHDEDVLGFMVENLGPKGISSEEEAQLYDTETHMRSVLDVILNQSYAKFAFPD